MFARIAARAPLLALASLASVAMAGPGEGSFQPEPPRFCTMIAGVVYHPVTGKFAHFTNGCQLAGLQAQGYVLDFPADLIKVAQGTLESIYAIGGETTGTALVKADGELIELDLSTNGFDAQFVEGAKVRVEGIEKQVEGVEIPMRTVLVVTAIVPL